MTEEKAKALFEEWVKILQLEEWDIRFHWRVDPKRMKIADCAGDTSYNDVCKQAVIEIADLDLYETDMDGFEVDYEQVLVHELMHLKLSILDDTDNELQNKTVHHLVDGLARSLIKAARSDPEC